MKPKALSPVGAVLRGVVAAAVGTAAMDALWYFRYRKEGGSSDPIAWEFASGLTDWDQAPVPAKVGKRLAEGYLGRELPPDSVRLMTNVTHWGYGLLWGSLFGLLAGSLRVRPALLGVPFGAVAWSAGYAVLPLGHFYKPIWEYDAKTLWKDLSAHLVYGAATGGTFDLLSNDA